MILGPQHTTQGWTRGNRGQDYTFGKKISHTHRCVCRCVCSHWTMWQLVSCVQELIWYLSSPQSICVGLCGLKPTVLLKKNIYNSSLLIATVAVLVCARKLQLLWFSFHAVVWIIGSSSLPSLLFLQSHEWKYRNYRQKKRVFLSVVRWWCCFGVLDYYNPVSDWTSDEVFYSLKYSLTIFYVI